MANDKIKSVTEKIENLLNTNKISYDDIEYNGGFITITIEWGDWKHEHLALRNFIKKFPNDYHYVGETPTEEDGSDTYSAEHYIIPINND